MRALNSARKDALFFFTAFLNIVPDRINVQWREKCAGNVAT